MEAMALGWVAEPLTGLFFTLFSINSILCSASNQIEAIDESKHGCGYCDFSAWMLLRRPP